MQIRNIVRRLSSASRSPEKSNLEISSDIKTINILFSNKDFLTAKLNELEFWSPDRVTYYKPSGFAQKRVTVKTLHIVVTDREQTLGQEVILSDGKEYIDSAFGMEYDTANQQVTLFIYFHSKALETLSNELLSSRVSYKILRTLFEITHPYLLNHKDFKERYKGIDEFTLPLAKLPNRSFVVVARSQ